MRLPESAHTSRPWRIHEVTRGFRLEDVWALPTPGNRADFTRLVRLFSSQDLTRASSPVLRALFAMRWTIGKLLGWDRPAAPGTSTARTLRDRLPDDLANAVPAEDFDALPFTPLYLTDVEFAAEIVNRTVHGVVHVGWVPDGAGGYRGQSAILVKRNGLLGTAYMAAIAPVRHLVVYPLFLRQMEQAWRLGARSEPPPSLSLG